MKLYFISLIVPLSVLLPNIIYFLTMPKDQPSPSGPADQKIKILTVFERIGQAGIFIAPLFFEMRVNTSLSIPVILGMSALLLLYYICWIRYFLNQRKYRYLYSSFWIIPIPLALSPIFFYLLASVLMQSVLLLLFTIILSIGHIPISWREYKITTKS